MRRSVLPFVLLAACSGEPKQEVGVYKAGNAEPLVVLLGGSEGGYLNMPWLREEFGKRGIATADIAYFRFDGGPAHLSEISVNAVADKITSLRTAHRCIAVVGASKGAELALLLASYRSVADVTVAITPSHVVWQSSKVSLKQSSSWTLDGEPLPFVPYRRFSVEAVNAVLDLNQALDLHVTSLEKVEDLAPMIIPVERIKEPVLLQGAWLDQIWPSAPMAQAAFDRAERLNPSHQIELIQYDLDHFLLSDWGPVDDMLDFVGEGLNDCQRH